MYLSNNFCCICVNNKTDLSVLSNLDEDNISFYDKLTLSVPEMCFKSLTDERLSCRECCDNIKIVYSFREKCLKSKILLVDYLMQLNSKNNIILDDKQVSTIKEEPSIDEEKNKADLNIGFVNVTDIKIEKEDNEDEKDNLEANTDEESDDEGQNLVEVMLEENVEDEPTTSVQVQLRDSADLLDYQNLLKPYMCQICLKRYTYPSQLKIHERTHLKSKLHQCAICQKTFKNFSSYLDHIDSHKVVGAYTCSECDKRFVDRETLAAHEKKHRGEYQHFSCTICEKSFRHQGSLSTHMKVHDGIKFECGVCQRKFSKKSDLTRHNRVHTGYRPHQCDVCEKRFSRNDHLVKHMKTHSGEVYKCNYCDKRYLQASSLALHIQKHTQADSYDCKNCAKRFFKKRHFRAHFNICNTLGHTVE